MGGEVNFGLIGCGEIAEQTSKAILELASSLFRVGSVAQERYR